MRRARRNNRPFKAKKTAIGTGLTGGFPDNTGEIQAIYRDGSAFSRTPHGEEPASARVSNHGNLHRSRPWPVLRDGASRLLRTRPSVGYCRPHGEERAPARVSNHGRLAQLSPLGPSFETALRASSKTRMSAWDGRFCCKQQRIYKAPLMQTPDAFGRRAQFQLWIFSYTVLAWPSKKRLSRVFMQSMH